MATHKQRSSRERKASGWLYRLWSSRLAGFTTWRFEFLVFLYPITRDNWRPEGRLLTLCSVSPSPLARPYAGSSEAWWRVDHCLQGGKGRKPGFPSNRPNSPASQASSVVLATCHRCSHPIQGCSPQPHIHSFYSSLLGATHDSGKQIKWSDRYQSTPGPCEAVASFPGNGLRLFQSLSQHWAGRVRAWERPVA